MKENQVTDEMNKAVKDLVKEIVDGNAPTPEVKPSEEVIKSQEAAPAQPEATAPVVVEEVKKSEGEQNAPKTEETVVETKVEDNGLGQLSEDEIELVKAWRATSNDEGQPEEITKSVEAPAQDQELKKALETQTQENQALKKSLEEQSSLIKSLTEKVEKMASQPAYEPKAVTTLEPIEKSEPQTQQASKRQVIDALLTLQQAGEATSHDISKYEVTNQLSKSLQEKVKTQILSKTK